MTKAEFLASLEEAPAKILLEEAGMSASDLSSWCQEDPIFEHAYIDAVLRNVGAAGRKPPIPRAGRVKASADDYVRAAMIYGEAGTFARMTHVLFEERGVRVSGRTLLSAAEKNDDVARILKAVRDDRLVEAADRLWLNASTPTKSEPHGSTQALKAYINISRPEAPKARASDMQRLVEARQAEIAGAEPDSVEN